MISGPQSRSTFHACRLALGGLVALALVAGVPVARADDQACSAELNLAQVETRVSTVGPDVLLARNGIDAARADVRTAGERPNPNLSLNTSSYDLRRGLGPGDLLHKQSDTILRLDQPIERGGKRGLRLDAAHAGLAASEADYAEQLRESLLTARTAFYALLRAQNKLDIAREIDGLQQQTLQAAERRQKAGDLSASDLARLRVEAFKSANDVQRAEADQRGARGALAVLIGCSPEGPFASAVGILPLPREPLTAAAVDLQRPDIAAAEAREAQAQKALALAKAQRVRDISIGLQVEHYPNGVPAPGDGQLLAGVGISVPLFLFNHYDGEIARAGADAETSRLQRLRTQAAAEADLAAARDALKAAAAILRNYQDSILPQAKTAADAIEYAYAHGAAPLLDLLDARRTLRSTRLEQADAEYEHAAAWASWLAASERYTPRTEEPRD